MTLDRILPPEMHALRADAERVAAHLVAPGRVVLACTLADSYVVGLLGAWLAGATVELLPNAQPGTLDRVDADAAIAYVLHDDLARQDRARKALYLPEVRATAGTYVPRAWPTIAVRMTTSGTTERPRSVDKAMDELLGELDVLAQIIAPARCVLATVPFSHLYGLLFGALLPLRFGARIASHRALLPTDVAAVIAAQDVDLVVSTPAHLRAMAEAPMPRDLRVVTSGARLPPALHAALVAAHGWHVTDVLGSTETGGIATRTQPGGTWTPLPRVVVTAPDHQLTVSSPWSPPTTLDDRIELHADGTFDHLSRGSELVKIAGKRAHAHELEATIRAVPGVTDVAMLVHAADGREARVAAAIVGTVERAVIADAIRRQFDAVFVPRILKFVPAIPRTDRGKVEAGVLRALLGIGEATTLPFWQTEPGRYAADVPSDLVFFRGHFVDQPILPGTVLVERLVWPIVRAELGDAAVMRGMRRLRFRKPVRPGQQLEIAIERKPGHVTFEVRCGEVVASGQLLVT